MRFYSETLGLPESAFSLLRDLIQERLGIFFENDRRDLLADKLSPRVLEAGFDSFLDYYYLLKYDPKAREEWGQVMNALSVQETYFWREMDQIRALTQTLIPQFLAGHSREKIRIWCAACATGEEPLTIAMALEEAGWFDRLPIEIMGSDASSTALEKARAGRFRERSFRNLPANLRQKYFKEGSGFWQADPDLLARIRWEQVNLMEEEQVRHLAIAPFIFCRNVFIYFSEKTILRAVRTFHRHMPDPGFLFVAAAESLLKLTDDFELEEIGGAFVYVKR
jgi:chemotaxis protein methyltransferase CheR